MGGKRRLGWALLISLIVHGLLYSRLPEPESRHSVPRFDVELVTLRAPEPAAVAEPEAPEPEKMVSEFLPESEPVSETVESVTEAVPNRTDLPPDVPDQPISRPLDLSRPADWDDIVQEVAVPAARLVFNAELGQALQAREAEIARSNLVEARQASIYGVADEDYRRVGPRGEAFKQDGRCVTLVEDAGVEEGQRWWAGTCTETRRNRFTLPTLEYDSLGRAISNP